MYIFSVLLINRNPREKFLKIDFASSTTKQINSQVVCLVLRVLLASLFSINSNDYSFPKKRDLGSGTVRTFPLLVSTLIFLCNDILSYFVNS